MAIALVAGCTTLFEADQPVPVGSPLRPAAPSADGVRFEVYWASLPAELEADHQAELWRYVQEERLDESLRLSLHRNGFRAGVISGAPHEELLRLLDPRPTEEPDASTEGTRLVETGVQKQELTVRPSVPGRINAAEPSPSVTLLLADEQEVWGESFRDLQAVYRLSIAERRDGGRVVTLAPELHYGREEKRYVPDASTTFVTPRTARQERDFPELRIETPIQVGEMLIVTSRAGFPRMSLGGFFHREEGGDFGRRAIVVRMIQAPPAAEFAMAQNADRPEF